jgi:hypothetical protein
MMMSFLIGIGVAYHARFKAA